MHYYKFNIADWHLATSHLSLEEEAVYFRLINYYYDIENPIPQETQSVIRRLRLGKHSDLVLIVLQEFFVLEDGFWHHKRCDDEIAQYHDKAEVNQINGKKGGRPKKTQSVSKQNPDITLTNNQEPITNNQKPINKIQAPEGVSIQVWNDFVEQRKKARAVISENVIKTIAKEAQKANWSLEQALAECAARGWRGFKAEWVKDKVQPVKVDKMKSFWQEIDAYGKAPLLGDK